MRSSVLAWLLQRDGSRISSSWDSDPTGVFLLLFQECYVVLQLPLLLWIYHRVSEGTRSSIRSIFHRTWLLRCFGSTNPNMFARFVQKMFSTSWGGIISSCRSTFTSKEWTDSCWLFLLHRIPTYSVTWLRNLPPEKVG